MENSSKTPKSAWRGRRRAIDLDGDVLVRTEPPPGGEALPLHLFPVRPSVNLAAWLRPRRVWFERLLTQHGALLMRRFSLAEPAALEEVTAAVADQGDALDYVYRSTPRSAVTGRVFTSTEYPPDREIPLHNELAYHRVWPRKLAFLCLAAAARGGATPIADSRRVHARLPTALRQRFEASGVTYVRNYGGPLDLHWREVFQTDRREEVAAYCEANDIAHEWHGEDGLRTRETCRAVAVHPTTGEPVWFNQAHLFHVSALGAQAEADLVRVCGIDGLPRHCVYGDGAPIAPETIRAIRDAYRAETIRFSWQAGDLLFIDNMLVAHGRDPFEGPRRVVVCMADPYDGSATGARAEVPR